MIIFIGRLEISFTVCFWCTVFVADGLLLLDDRSAADVREIFDGRIYWIMY